VSVIKKFTSLKVLQAEFDQGHLKLL